MTTIALDILYRDRGAAKGLQDLAKHTERTSASLRGMKVAAGIGLVAVTAAAVKFGTSSVKAYAQAEDAQKALAFAFAKFPALADTNQKALQKLNSALQQKTRFDDDNIASGQAVLAQFKLTGQQITQVTPLLLDYASKTGKDIPNAARDVGKALLGNAKALKNIGISYKSTGDASKDFTNITALMREKVGGFAELEGKTASGRLAILKNQFGELQESAGSVLLPALTKLVGGALKVVNAFNGLSGSTKAVLTGFGGGIVTIGLSALAIGKLAVTVKAARDAFNALGIASKRAVIGIPVLGVALAAVGAVIGFFAGQAAKATQRTEDIGQALHTMTGEVTRNTAALDQNVRATTAKALQDAGALTAATKLGIGLDTLTSATLGNQTAIAEVHAKLLAAYRDGNSQQVQAASKLSSSFGSVSRSVGDAIAKENEYRAAVGGVESKSYNAATAVNLASKKVEDAGKKAATARQKLQDLAASMFNASKGALALSGSEISFQQAVDDATKAAKANGKTLDTNTQKGRDNKTSLNNLVTASQAYISKLVETGKSSKRVTAATADARAEFVRVATKMGLSSAAARDLATRYFKIPKGVKTKIDQPGMTDADKKAKALAARYNDVPKKVSTSVSVKFGSSGKVALHYGRQNFIANATGGVLPGFTPGRDVHTFRSVSPGVPDLKLSGGEAVMRPEWTRLHGGAPGVARENEAAKQGRTVGFADGGTVPSMRPATRAPQVAERAGSAIARDAGAAVAKAAMAELKKQAAAAGGGPIGKGGYASALNYARQHKGHPYQFGTLWDCSGFMSALHSIILGQRPHRRYTTTAFHGAHAAGFTRGKSSPFRVGVRPLAGKFGHMAGTLNGVNVESSGGVGVRVGGGARGAGSGMFSWRGGLAKGGVIGDMPFDLLDPRGERYTPWLADLVHKAGYHRGGRIGGDGPERILSPRQNRAFEHLVRVMDRRGGGACTYNVTINAPNYIGSQAELKQTLVSMARRGDLAVIQR